LKTEGRTSVPRASAPECSSFSETLAESVRKPSCGAASALVLMLVCRASGSPTAYAGSREVEMMKAMVVVVSVCAIACSKSSEQPPAEPPAATAAPTAAAPATASPAAASADDPCARGQPYRVDCAVVAKSKCFETKEAACACEGCPADRCVLLEEVPPSAACE
jgi:hypothetical protein